MIAKAKKELPRYTGKREDYRLWAFKAEAYLTELKLWTIVNGKRDHEALSDDEATRDNYIERNGELFNAIIGMVDHTLETGASFLTSIMNDFNSIETGTNRDGKQLWQWIKERGYHRRTRTPPARSTPTRP